MIYLGGKNDAMEHHFALEWNFYVVGGLHESQLNLTHLSKKILMGQAEFFSKIMGELQIDLIRAPYNIKM